MSSALLEVILQIEFEVMGFLIGLLGFISGSSAHHGPSQPTPGPRGRVQMLWLPHRDPHTANTSWKTHARDAKKY